jgi:hypothetical protein
LYVGAGLGGGVSRADEGDGEDGGEQQGGGTGHGAGFCCFDGGGVVSCRAALADGQGVDGISALPRLDDCYGLWYTISNRLSLRNRHNFLSQCLQSIYSLLEQRVYVFGVRCLPFAWVNTRLKGLL